MSLLLLVIAMGSAVPASSALRTDRDIRVLVVPTDDAARRLALTRAGVLMDRRKVGIEIGGAVIRGRDLRLVARKKQEPILRAIREHTKRAIDLDDFIYFLDDVLGRRFKERDLVVPADRARKAGILIHPRDVFRNDPKVYGDPRIRLVLDPPPTQDGLIPPDDGALLGPAWAARYRQPQSEDKRLDALAAVNRSFADRVRSLQDQLQKQGALVYIEATVRPRERGYLMYGAHLLRRAKSRRQLYRGLDRIERLNREWGLSIPISWRHPNGWRATREAARRMADTYGVDYATEGGAKNSNHYDGAAIDIWAVGLPRTLKLKAPDGATVRFDLAAPDETRDLNLSPDVIEWVEKHFRFEKLRTDYPHWGDADHED